MIKLVKVGDEGGEVVSRFAVLHEGRTDEGCVVTGLCGGGEVGWLFHGRGGDPYFSILAEPDEIKADLPVGFQRVEVAGIDLDDARSGLAGKYQVCFIEDFDDGMDAEAFSLFPEGPQQPGIRSKTDDQEHSRGSCGGCGRHLQRIHDEVFAQEWNSGSCHAIQESQFSFEELFFRQYRNT